jgi:hypothetical protein
MFYIFKNVEEETGRVSYGIVPEEKAADKALLEELAFAKLNELPAPPANSEGKEYFLKYNESKKQFFFEL